MNRRFVYILGKNRLLSIAELVEVAKMFSLPLDFEIDNDFVISPADIDFERLGGVLKKSIILEYGKDIESLLQAFIEHVEMKGNVARVGFSFYNCEHNIEPFKHALKEEKIKYKIVNARNEKISHTDIIKRNVSEFMVLKHDEKYYLARTMDVHNPFEFRKRDLMRPHQRAIFSIPPRLCRIMINLSGVKEGVLLDPFCGIGGILQEAVLMGYDIMGSDISQEVVKMAVKNLEWVCKEYGIMCKDIKRKLRVCDAKKLSLCYKKGEIDAIVTEPYLGKPLKKRPDRKKARKIIAHLQPLYESFIKESSKLNVKSLVFTSPLFTGLKGSEDKISLDIESMAERNHFMMYNPLEDIGINNMLLEKSERHRFVRMISILRPL